MELWEWSRMRELRKINVTESSTKLLHFFHLDDQYTGRYHCSNNITKQT